MMKPAYLGFLLLICGFVLPACIHVHPGKAAFADEHGVTEGHRGDERRGNPRTEQLINRLEDLQREIEMVERELEEMTRVPHARRGDDDGGRSSGRSQEGCPACGEGQSKEGHGGMRDRTGRRGVRAWEGGRGGEGSARTPSPAGRRRGGRRAPPPGWRRSRASRPGRPCRRCCPWPPPGLIVGFAGCKKSEIDQILSDLDDILMRVAEIFH